MTTRYDESKQLMKVIIIAVVMIWFSLPLYGQDLKSDCVALDPSRPQIYVTYERNEPKQKGRQAQRIYRLQNNSTCEAIFLTNSEGSLQLKKKANGGIQFERNPDLPQNIVVDLHYRLVRWASKDSVALITDGCLVFRRRLLSNTSTLFAVPAGYFRKIKDVGMMVEYDLGGTVQQAGFPRSTYYQQLSKK